MGRGFRGSSDRCQSRVWPHSLNFPSLLESIRMKFNPLNTDTHKICSRCSQLKQRSLFYAGRNRPTISTRPNVDGACKECFKVQMQIRRANRSAAKSRIRSARTLCRLLFEALSINELALSIVPGQPTRTTHPN